MKYPMIDKLERLLFYARQKTFRKKRIILDSDVEKTLPLTYVHHVKGALTGDWKTDTDLNVDFQDLSKAKKHFGLENYIIAYGNEPHYFASICTPYKDEKSKGITCTTLDEFGELSMGHLRASKRWLRDLFQEEHAPWYREGQLITISIRKDRSTYHKPFNITHAIPQEKLAKADEAAKLSKLLRELTEGKDISASLGLMSSKEQSSYRALLSLGVHMRPVDLEEVEDARLHAIGDLLEALIDAEKRKKVLKRL